MLNEKWQKKIMAALCQIGKKKNIYIYIYIYAFFLNVKPFFFFFGNTPQTGVMVSPAHFLLFFYFLTIIKSKSFSDD